MTHQPDISDEAIRQATGRSWREWLDLLDDAGMAQRTREEIIVFLREEHGVPAWWQQSIANRFEQSIDRLPEHETDDGFQALVSRALPLDAATVFEAWTDEAGREKWLRREDFELTTMRASDTVRGKWIPDGSLVDVDIADAGGGRCELTIKHRKLAGEEFAEKMQQFWEQSIDRLVERVEGAK